MEELLDKIRNKIKLSTEAEQHLYSIAKEKVVSKGEILIRQGQVVKKTFFVTEGCLRSYCIDKNGKEHTLQFAIKDWWISDFIAIYNNELATLTVECITDSTLLSLMQKN